MAVEKLIPVEDAVVVALALDRLTASDEVHVTR